jgi:MOSC domain-containing protein YiiM
VLDHAADGSLIRKAGVMAVVLAGGRVAAGDPIEVQLPQLTRGEHRPLVPV